MCVKNHDAVRVAAVHDGVAPVAFSATGRDATAARSFARSVRVGHQDLTFNLARTCTVLGMGTYTIGEAARRSGFSASALRYYEQIGLVEPSHRTAAQYRVYDDGDLARLAFIARAKQLGCTLDEINDLVGIWDGQQCGPVQKRFHDLVTGKLADAQRQIEELSALGDQLREAARRLAGPAVDGPCDEGCACLALDGALAPVELLVSGTQR
jgi:MerR family transcriptional regulator, copper efflux regulator